MTSDLDTAGAFSLDLGPDLREMRDWVHGFAAGADEADHVCKAHGGDAL